MCVITCAMLVMVLAVMGLIVTWQKIKMKIFCVNSRNMLIKIRLM